ncbi:hypothetical protein LCGC14_1636980, partial [marine sediment metagenome]
GLAGCKVESEQFAGGVAKFLPPDMQSRLREATGAADGDILMFIADEPNATNKILAALRCKLGEDLKLYDPGEFRWCWVTDFPLVEWNADEDRWDSPHHPFTSPRPEDLDRLESDPGSITSRAYDIILNGTELAGGSIRIHDSEVQRKIFALLGISDEQAESRFGFFLRALRYGAPPHGGIAFGLDRVVMMMVGAESLREVIAFPKTQRGQCLLTDAPSHADEKQLRECGVRVLDPEGKGDRPKP